MRYSYSKMNGTPSQTTPLCRFSVARHSNYFDYIHTKRFYHASRQSRADGGVVNVAPHTRYTITHLSVACA